MKKNLKRVACIYCYLASKDTITSSLQNRSRRYGLGGKHLDTFQALPQRSGL